MSSSTLIQQEQILDKFRRVNPELFQKNDFLLFRHLGTVLGLLMLTTALALLSPWIGLKILLGTVNVVFWFALINVTIHHHHTHHNAAEGGAAKRFLDLIYLLVLPNAPKRRSRYTRAHLNHHARPFHESDVDHHYGTERYLEMKKSVWGRIFYFLELTFVGAHVPGWQDDAYMNQVSVEEWNCKDYQEVKRKERREAVKLAVIHWMLFLVAAKWLPLVAWGWGFPMILVKNWAHYLGQFQHYDERLLAPGKTALERTKSFHVPAWLNYLVGGEISGHFLHHLFPELPYYRIEDARSRLVQDPELTRLFVFY